jgi:hypothetical protein
MGPAACSFLFCYYFYFFEKNILKCIQGFSIKCHIVVFISTGYRYAYSYPCRVAVDLNMNLYGSPRIGLDAGEGVHGDGRVVGVMLRRVIIIFVEHLDGEELFAQVFVPIGEEVIANKTFIILVALCDLHQRHADGAGDSFID